MNNLERIKQLIQNEIDRPDHNNNNDLIDQLIAACEVIDAEYKIMCNEIDTYAGDSAGEPSYVQGVSTEFYIEGTDWHNISLVLRQLTNRVTVDSNRVTDVLSENCDEVDDEQIQADRDAQVEQANRVKSENQSTTNRLTTDPTDERLTHGVNDTPVDQAEVYLVLSEEERRKGFVRPVRYSYVHKVCGRETEMGQELSETYARDPKFYGSTYCVGCKMHKPVREFYWSCDGIDVGS